ncbi:MAG: 5' DNA nuclease [Rhizobiales bacterium]|nr:5' DNA nuclease [Hyphomicrobiales bacterium]
MTGPADKHQKGEGAPADKAAAPVNPFLHSASAFAAAAAAGLDFQRQLANTMLGFFESALGGARSETKAPAEAAPVVNKPAEPAVAPFVKAPVVAAVPEPVVEPVRVAKAAISKAPVAKAKPKVVLAKEPAAKPAAPKAVVQRAAPAPVVEAPAAPVRKARAVKDDLKQLSGIGPKLEQVLNGKGINRFADIAAWSDEDVRRIDAELGFDGRIGRDDWVGQAKALTGGRKTKK